MPPVVLIIFNRPAVTARVFAAIRAARPERLLIVADGPRNHVPDDAGKCATTRAAVAKIDWPCEVLRKFADSNLGLRRNVSEGLTWAFDQVEEAIILEDDCLPDPTFFSFCETLLEEFRDDERVGMIGGTNPSAMYAASAADKSYRFTRYPYIWGWATWRRAWKFYDDRMSAWPRLRKSGWLRKIGLCGSGVNFWRRQFDDCFSTHRDSFDTWDVPWTLACWSHHFLTVIPNQNLIANLGFGADATHTKRSSRIAQMATHPMQFPLVHPASVAADHAADNWVQKNVCESASRLERLFWTLRLPIPIWAVRRMQRWLGK